ncbi:sigma-70 family RNA polymerase sigma factor [Paracoccus sp. (in: a-proteobacteria)]|uniref:sigma-70 family RNA polymerase sigma factor n=1 Tax=Paracoccus sp. TaxID=267 RepID=UPI00396C415F
MSDELLDHIRALRAYAQSLCGNPTEADDLTQETLVRAIDKADRYQKGTYMRAWLFTIMRNRFYTNRKRAVREPTGGADCVSLGQSTQATQEWHIRAKEMRHALDQLPVHYREAIVLVGVLGESYTDTAEILQVDVGTVKSRVSRARKMLRDMLEPAETVKPAEAIRHASIALSAQQPAFVSQSGF